MTITTLVETRVSITSTYNLLHESLFMTDRLPVILCRENKTNVIRQMLQHSAKNGILENKLALDTSSIANILYYDTVTTFCRY